MKEEDYILTSSFGGLSLWSVGFICFKLIVRNPSAENQIYDILIKYGNHSVLQWARAMGSLSSLPNRKMPGTSKGTEVKEADDMELTLLTLRYWAPTYSPEHSLEIEPIVLLNVTSTKNDVSQNRIEILALGDANQFWNLNYFRIFKAAK